MRPYTKCSLKGVEDVVKSLMEFSYRSGLAAFASRACLAELALKQKHYCGFLVSTQHQAVDVASFPNQKPTARVGS